MGYAHNGQTLTHVIGETWRNNQCPMPSWEVQYVREFRYDGARQRYAVIEHDPTVYMNTLTFSPISTKWTDYDGDEVYGDFTVTNAGNPTTIANVRSFEPGLAKVDPFTTTHNGNTAYYHGDMIGTTRDLSGANGNGSSPSVYSAFGERISGTVPTDGTRYNYAGAWGYQEQPDFPFLHVGHRYYDPSTGRFIQRDPIGILGGMNVFEYTFSIPSAFVDQQGLTVDPGVIGEFANSLANKWPKNTRLPNGRFGRAPWMRRFLKGAGKRLGTLGLCIGAWELGKTVGDALVDNTPIEDWVAEAIVWVTNRPGPGPGTTLSNGTWVPSPGGGVTHCFVEGTWIATDSGMKTIEKFVAGDCVRTCADPESNVRGDGLQPVIEVITGSTTCLVTIELLNDAEQLRCSPEHRFFVSRAGWVRARDLKVGDALTTASGGLAIIGDVEITRFDAPITVYNLEVFSTHVYYVGTSQILVHNMKP